MDEAIHWNPLNLELKQKIPQTGFYKFLNNAAFSKTMKHAIKRVDIKLVRTADEDKMTNTLLNKLLWEVKYSTKYN